MCGCAERRRTWLCDVAQAIRPLCLPGDDGLVRDCLVGVAGEHSRDPAVLWVAANVQPCPAVVGFLLDVKSESEIPILHVIPGTVASHSRICVEHVNKASRQEWHFRSNLLPSWEGIGVGTPEQRRTKSPHAVRAPGRDDG